MTFREDPEERDRRPVVAIVLLLLLTPVLLCGAAQIALRGVTPGQVNAGMRSMLQADYSPAKPMALAPVNPTYVGTVRAEQATNAAPRTAGTMVVFGTVEVSSTRVAEVTETSPPAATATALPAATPSATSTQGATSTPPPPTATVGITAVATATPNPTGTPRPPIATATPPPPPTATQPAVTLTPALTATATLTPAPTATATFTPPPPTSTLTPPPTATDTPTLTPTPVPGDSITGSLFIDPEHNGDAPSELRLCLPGLWGVTVRLLDGGTEVAATTTDLGCTFTLAAPTANTVYTVEVNLGTCGTPCPEQISESDGTTTNTGAGALGGEAPDISNDHRVDVAYGTAPVSRVSFGFSYEVVTNTANSGQGSLRQAILNANNLLIGQNIRFAGLFAPYSITPTSGLPTITGVDTSISGAGKAVTLDGSSAGSAPGLLIEGHQVSIREIRVQNFQQSGIVVTDAQGVALTGNTITGNEGDGVTVTGANAEVLIRFNGMVGNGGLGIDLNDDGLTPNDGVADNDSGPNALVNYPMALGAGPCPGNARFRLSQESVGGSVDIYASAGDASGHGQGETFHISITDGGSDDLDGAADGEICFDTVALGISGLFATLTTTAGGGTSEFGPNVTLP